MRETVHPDLALLLQPERQGICCLALPAHVRGLEALHPFHQYTEDGITALLFDGITDPCAFARAAEDALGRAGGEAGMSGPFALPPSACGCLRKARLALETGRKYAPGERLYTMARFGEAALADACAAALEATGFCAGDFYGGVLSRLARTDAAEGARYLPSLRAYLENGLNLREAAAAQGVHRNTLAYRMRRVQERFSLDLSNKNTCFELLFSFWLRDHFPCGEAEEPAAWDGARAERLLWRCAEGRGDPNAAAPFGMCACLVMAGRLNDAGRDALILRLSRLGVPCAFDDAEIYLACAPEAAGRLEAEVARACGDAGVPAAVTGPFGSNRLRQKLALCRWTARMSGQGVRSLGDIGSTLFFTAVSRHVSLSPFLCEEVIRVMDEDATKGSALSRSLFMFLLHFNDTKEAAEKLGMHRNTMEYQMRKIEGFIGGPLDKSRRFWMMCTYRMLALPDFHPLP